jgi:hypothetical protein
MRIVDKAISVDQNIGLSVRYDHFVLKRGRYFKPLDIGNYLIVTNRRDQPMMMAETANDLANDPQDPFIPRRVD